MKRRSPPMWCVMVLLSTGIAAAPAPSTREVATRDLESRHAALLKLSDEIAAAVELAFQTVPGPGSAELAGRWTKALEAEFAAAERLADAGDRSRADAAVAQARRSDQTVRWVLGLLALREDQLQAARDAAAPAPQWSSIADRLAQVEQRLQSIRPGAPEGPWAGLLEQMQKILGEEHRRSVAEARRAAGWLPAPVTGALLPPTPAHRVQLYRHAQAAGDVETAQVLLGSLAQAPQDGPLDIGAERADVQLVQAGEFMGRGETARGMELLAEAARSAPRSLAGRLAQSRLNQARRNQQQSALKAARIRRTEWLLLTGLGLLCGLGGLGFWLAATAPRRWYRRRARRLLAQARAASTGHEARGLALQAKNATARLPGSDVAGASIRRAAGLILEVASQNVEERVQAKMAPRKRVDIEAVLRMDLGTRDACVWVVQWLESHAGDPSRPDKRQETVLAWLRKHLALQIARSEKESQAQARWREELARRALKVLADPGLLFCQADNAIYLEQWSVAESALGRLLRMELSSDSTERALAGMAEALVAQDRASEVVTLFQQQDETVLETPAVKKWFGIALSRCLGSNGPEREQDIQTVLEVLE